MAASQLLGAVDIGGTKTALGLITGSGEVVAMQILRTPSRPASTTMADLVARSWIALWAKAGQPPVVGVGVSVPGPVLHSGLVARAFDWDWAEVPLAAELRQRLRLPVAIENDVNCCALAEALWGNGQSVSEFFWLQLSTGVGGGVVTGGRVYKGSVGFAGEIGHVVIEENGPVCHCGGRGCLETLVSGPAVARRYAEAGGALVDAPMIFVRASQGEPRAEGVVRGVVRDLGRGIALVLNILDPALVVLGGGVTKSLGVYVDQIAAVARGRTPRGRSVPLVVSGLGDRAALLGAAAFMNLHL